MGTVSDIVMEVVFSENIVKLTSNSFVVKQNGQTQLGIEIIHTLVKKAFFDLHCLIMFLALNQA